jgi:hypothetical protein
MPTSVSVQKRTDGRVSGELRAKQNPFRNERDNYAEEVLIEIS